MGADLHIVVGCASRAALLQTEIYVADEEQQDACHKEADRTIERIVEYNIEEQQLAHAQHSQHQTIKAHSL